MSELSRKTCLHFVQTQASADSIFNSVNYSTIAIFPRNSSANLQTVAPVYINVSSWDSMANELVNAFCLFDPRAQLGMGHLKDEQNSTPSQDCISRKSPHSASNEEEYITMLDAEKINALYNCGGEYHYVLNQKIVR